MSPHYDQMRGHLVDELFDMYCRQTLNFVPHLGELLLNQLTDLIDTQEAQLKEEVL